MIFTGIAGGVADETKVMDQVIATKLVEHDYGKITNDGFIWLSGDPGVGIEPGAYYDTDLLLTNLAYECAVEVLGAEHVFKGVIATGDQFIASEDYVKRLQDDYNAYACEMEGASVQAMCDFRGVEVYMFFTGGDLLDAPEWTNRKKKGQIKDTQHDSGHFEIALRLAEYVSDR